MKLFSRTGGARRFLWLIVIATTGMLARAQDRLVGTVTNSMDGTPLKGVSVRLVDPSGKIKKFATTKAGGVFTLLMPSDLSDLTLQVARMGFATKDYPLDSIDRSDTLRVKLDVQARQLKEVGVRAKRIRENGDTVTYAVGQFTRKQDRSIGEVMNRMPGLDVDRSGKVQYQGTDINRLYVEGNDLTGGSYGVVTKNLQAEDVSAVEVLENHQPMQVLRGISFSDQAAINLRLKQKSKAKVMAHGSVGGGYGERAGGLYTGDLFLMTVKGRFQNITSAKLDNTGERLGSLSGFFGNEGGESLSPYVSIGGVTSGGKSLFNRSATVSSTSSWKNRRGGQWRIKAGYDYNHLWDDRTTVTTYHLPDGERAVTEQRHADNHEHTGAVTVNYEVNEKMYFLNNNFNAEASRNDIRLDITGTLPNHQRLRTPNYDVTNRLNIIRRFGPKRIVTFNSINQWLSRPERLSVTMARSDSSEMHNYGSRISQHAFFTDERASYGFILGRVVVSLEGGLAGFFRHLATSVRDIPDIVPEDAAHNISTDYFKLFVQPKFELNLRRLSLNLYVPLSYYSYFFGGALANRNEIFAAPNLKAQWKPNPRHTINLSASARRSPASLHHIHSGEIMADYRTFNAGIDDYYSSSGQNVNLLWEWRNVRRGWFANLSAYRSWGKSKYGVAQNLIGYYVVNSYYNSPTSSESTGFSGKIQKSIDTFASTFTLNVNGSESSGNFMSQGVLMDRKMRSLMLAPSTDMRFTSWLNGNYNFTFSTSRMLAGAGSGWSRNDSYNHTFSISATPADWVFTLRGRHSRVRIPGAPYDNSMDLSAKVGCRMSKKVELSVNASNLLDSRHSVSRSFNDLTTFESITFTRGREFLLTLRLYR